jgi:hypothetical protein
MSDALLIPIAAVSTGVVVVVVAIAVVLVVLFVTVSIRDRQRRGVKRRDETRHDVAEAHERAARAKHERCLARISRPSELRCRATGGQRLLRRACRTDRSVEPSHEICVARRMRGALKPRGATHPSRQRLLWSTTHGRS